MTDQVNTQPRVFKIGTTRIVENESTLGLSNEQVRQMFKGTYPEVANATISERNDGETRMVEFLPQPGRKG